MAAGARPTRRVTRYNARMPQWDPNQYLKFAGERTQAVVDLLHRIQIENPRRIADLGCGPGNSTEMLRGRWAGRFDCGSRQFTRDA